MKVAENKHTSGPWSYRPTGTWPDTNHHLGIYSDDARMTQVAKVEGMGYVSEANACLIAAAPELLEALRVAKELAGVMEGLSSGRSDDEWIWAAQAKINAAIAKAEGRSK